MGFGLRAPEQLKEYLRTLQENGLIDYETGRRYYRITDCTIIAVAQ